MDNRNGEFEPLVVQKPKIDTTIFRDEPMIESDEDTTSAPSGSPVKHARDEHDHGHCAHHEMSLDVVREMARNSKGLSFRVFALLIGMGVHSIFEGLALGLQDSQTGFLNLLIGVLLHEVLCVGAFALTLAQQETTFASGFLSIIIMSATIPVGTIVGILVPKEMSVGALIARLTLEGLAAGTFVYVACVEILGAEMGDVSHGGGSGGVMKAVFVIFGFVMFLVVLALSGH